MSDLRNVSFYYADEFEGGHFVCVAYLTGGYDVYARRENEFDAEELAHELNQELKDWRERQVS